MGNIASLNKLNPPDFVGVGTQKDSLRLNQILSSQNGVEVVKKVEFLLLDIYQVEPLHRFIPK